MRYAIKSLLEVSFSTYICIGYNSCSFILFSFSWWFFFFFSHHICSKLVSPSSNIDNILLNCILGQWHIKKNISFLFLIKWVWIQKIGSPLDKCWKFKCESESHVRYRWESWAPYKEECPQIHCLTLCLDERFKKFQEIEIPSNEITCYWILFIS